MHNRLIRSFAATVLLAVIGVAAVLQLGSGEPATAVEIVADSQPTTTGVPAADPVPPSTVEVEPFVYRIGLLGSPTTDNFWAYFGSSPTVWDAYVLGPTKGSLLRLDPATGDLHPELAGAIPDPTWDREGWHVVATLRGDVAWSDGEPLTAADFAFTFETVRSLDLDGQWADVFPAQVTSITALDRYTLDIRFSGRPGLEVWPYGVGTAPVMAEHFWSEMAAGSGAGLLEAPGAADPASGPVALVEIGDDAIRGRSNPGYPGDVVDAIEYHVYADVASLTGALGDGSIHTMLSPKGLTPDEAEAMDAVDGVEVVTSPLFGIRYLAFNVMRDPMQEVAFRRAVDYLIDREALGQGIAGAPAATALLPSSSSFGRELESSPEGEATADLEEVVASLEDAGYNWSEKPAIVDGSLAPGTGLMIDGQEPAPLTILTAGDVYDPARSAYAEEVARLIEYLGFEVIPVTTDFDTVVDLTYQRGEDGSYRYDMALLGWSLGNPGLPSFYGDLLGSESPANNSGYESEEMDALLSRYEAVTGVEEARILLSEIEEVLARDLPYIPLYESQIVEAFRADAISFGAVPGVGGIQGSLGAILTVSGVD